MGLKGTWPVNFWNFESPSPRHGNCHNYHPIWSSRFGIEDFKVKFMHDMDREWVYNSASGELKKSIAVNSWYVCLTSEATTADHNLMTKIIEHAAKTVLILRINIDSIGNFGPNSFSPEPSFISIGAVQIVEKIFLIP